MKGFSETGNTGNTGNTGKFVAIHFLLTRRDGIGALILADDSRSWRDNLLVAKFDSTLSTGAFTPLELVAAGTRLERAPLKRMQRDYVVVRRTAD